MKILILDNYDSFTYNLVHAIEKISSNTVDVFRNDKISIDEIEKYDNILLSPGPGLPADAGVLLDVIKRFAPSKNILGVCLGHQAIGETFGGQLFNLPKVYHGLSTNATIIKKDILFESLPNKIKIGRYHSWSLKFPLPEDLIATAIDDEGQVMALKHKKFKVRGVQFHPESVLTPHGDKILENWLTLS